jgi:hypothetical protein
MDALALMLLSGAQVQRDRSAHGISRDGFEMNMMAGAAPASVTEASTR